MVFFNRFSMFLIALTTPSVARKRKRTSLNAHPNSEQSVTCVEFTQNGRELITSGAVDG